MNVSSAAVHLLHSDSGLTLKYVASPDARVDVGTIAAHFSLQPNSVRFNGHFISRDAHFISGLTWRELLTFFQSRGFNWGNHPLSPVEVQGRSLLRAPNEGVVASSLECVCHDNSRSAKRSALQSSLVSPSKRTKHETESDVLTQSLAPHKLKRHVLGDESTVCTLNKQIRHEINSGGWEVASDSVPDEGEVIHQSKRKRSSDDACTDRSLWKRLKEVKV